MVLEPLETFLKYISVVGWRVHYGANWNNATTITTTRATRRIAPTTNQSNLSGGGIGVPVKRLSHRAPAYGLIVSGGVNERRAPSDQALVYYSVAPLRGISGSQQKEPIQPIFQFASDRELESGV